MYRRPISIALFVFIAATVAEIICIEVLRGSLFGWMGEPDRIPQVLVMVGFNALQGALLGYAAHRAAANAIELRRAEQERWRLAEELRPALSLVQYAAYSTANKRCIDVCNDAVRRAAEVIMPPEGRFSLGLIRPK
jgi:hypothetical protein